MKGTRRRLQSLRADQDPRLPKLTQSRLAAKAGMTAARYWLIENGETTPTKDEKAAIAKALGVSVSAIAWPTSLHESATV